MDGWMGGCMDGWMEGCMDGWMDGWMYGWMDVWMDEWMDGIMIIINLSGLMEDQTEQILWIYFSISLK